MLKEAVFGLIVGVAVGGVLLAFPIAIPVIIACAVIVGAIACIVAKLNCWFGRRPVLHPSAAHPPVVNSMVFTGPAVERPQPKHDAHAIEYPKKTYGLNGNTVRIDKVLPSLKENEANKRKFIDAIASETQSVSRLAIHASFCGKGEFNDIMRILDDMIAVLRPAAVYLPYPDDGKDHTTNDLAYRNFFEKLSSNNSLTTVLGLSDYAYHAPAFVEYVIQAQKTT